MPVPIRFPLITIPSMALLAGCGPLPAGAPPASSSAPTRAVAAAVGNRSNDLRPATAGPSGSPPVASAAAAGPSIPLSNDYEAALAQAEAEAKPLLLLFTAPWCEYSRRLETEVLAAAAAQAAAAPYVCVRVDFARQDLREQYRVKVFPTIIPATSRGTASQRLTGAQTVESFVTGLTTALTAVNDPRPAAEAAIQR
jgi:thiol-disulfide isomerase/thioredoxin